MIRTSPLPNFVVAGIAIAAVSGCAAQARYTPEADGLPRGAGSGDDASWHVVRQVSGIGHAAVLYSRSIHVEPAIRPVSFVSSGVSFAAKSVTGILGRLSIGIFGVRKPGTSYAPGGDVPPMDLLEFERQLDRITGTRSSRGVIRFLVDGDEFFSRLEAAVDEASRSIDVRTYIFDNDDYAVAFARKLGARGGDGVRVRVIYDSLGTMSALQTDPDSLPDGYRPPVSMRRFLARQPGVSVRSNALQWFSGDHSKTIIVDGQTAFVGGMNIGREYRYDWHDLMMEVHGPVVDELQFEADKAWSRAGPFGDLAHLLTLLRGARLEAGGEGYPVRILQTRNFDSDIYRAQIAAARMSKRYIYIENAYLSDDRIRHELAEARRRGVDVRVIFPQSGNHGPMNASNRVTINELLKHGVRVFLFPGMTHVKAAVYDGWACVGSANFDKMSLQINRELNLATSDPGTVTALLEKVFRPDFEISSEVLEPLEIGLADRIAEAAADELL